MLIEIEKIKAGERLRSRLDPVKLRQLADDMERNGQLQEIVVAIKWGTNSRGVTVVEQAALIAGYRRLEAAKLLGWTQIRCTRQLGGDIDPASAVDMLRAEFSENEMRENFTEMERVAFGAKLKERIAKAARERMIAGKKLGYEYDPESGYKVWSDGDSSTQDAEAISEAGKPDFDPPLNSAEGQSPACRPR
jgi:ParB-like chromosome segregation protein Spo0J